MTSEVGWTPVRTYDLEPLLASSSLGGVRIGMPQDDIEALLGPPEMPIAKLSRKSKIWISVYGNASLLISNRRVNGISIDFHGNRFEMVRAAALNDWRLREWTAFAELHGWRQEQTDDVLNLKKGGDSIALARDGSLRLVFLA